MQGIVGGVTRLAEWLAGRSGWQRLGLAAIAGALTVFAMPPFGLWPLLFVTYPVLLWLLDGIEPDAEKRFVGWRSAALTAWAFGFGFFLAGLYWIGSAFLVDADQFAWMLPFVAVIMPGGLALFFAGAAVAARAVSRTGATRVLTFVVAFALAEWLRGHVLTGFPWNSLGYGFSVSDTLVQATSLWGLYGHTVLAALVATAPALLAGPGVTVTRSRAAAFVCFAGVLPLALFGFGLWRLSLPTPADVADVKVRIVQPNIAQKDKWRPELRAVNFSRLLRLSRAQDNLDGITHVIWPESAPPFLLADNPDARALIADTLPDGVHLITGAVRAEPLPQTMPDGRWARFFNSVMVLDSNATIAATYDKAHLVPFGEYLPAQRLLNAIGLQQLTRQRGGYSSGPGPQSVNVPGMPFVGPLICYEIIFPGNSVGDYRPGWLLNATNDAWFGDSVGPRQHFFQARMRAVEQGLPLIRAANTGISAVIGPRGQIRAHLRLGEAGVLDQNLPGKIDPTIYSRNGDLGFWIICIALVLTILYSKLTKHRQY
ncbi:Apolipoprotein N-acyltransferase/GT2 [Candidatus Phaeomarinobacter ectocarpi]|uniref:Apolipoprotein N-acyltransferase n=1 Tax=Candidatus Phaeomarinibacter ectocarpi TaxID=1458461 RepID=X5MD41_9HYPH|nr:apolipoprotein N-acyltransferase [Candidatus Phaeomarinobacter ectocarpi]CDO59847.1 Apolipoprotein N-acyltransferase/GT2 [Candidatus Phaeomarinobacter ectocarpi]